MSQDSTQDFGKWRSLLWPIHGFEMKKVLPLFFMFFCISFNYTILRDAKDAIMVAGSASGSEVIPFLKVYGTVPCAIVFMLVYSKASNILTKPKLFYASLIPFVAFFIAYPALIVPYQDALTPSSSADALQAFLPKGLAGLADCYRHWSKSVFYVVAELWGSVALSLLFWGFTNEIAKVSEAKRFYAVLGIGANVALMFSGPYIIWVNNLKTATGDKLPWETQLWLLLGMAFAMGVMIMLIYHWMQKNVLTDPRLYDVTQVKKKKSKPKMGMLDSLRFLMTSKYVACLAMMVIGYGVAINLVEVTWKGEVKALYPTESEYMGFMGRFSFFTGLWTVIMMFFVGGNSMRIMGWKFTALITPVALLITGAIFFGLVLNKDMVTMKMGVSTATVLFLSVSVGALQNIFSKSCKYSCFDPAKEMAYIPMDQETKVKGKAAVDVVGARLGKSGGSFIQQFLFGVFGGLGGAMPAIAGILFLMSVLWIAAVTVLAKLYEQACVKQDDQVDEANRAAAFLDTANNRSAEAQAS